MRSPAASERECGRDGEAGVPERGSQRLLAGYLERERQVEHGDRCEHEHVIHQRDGLVVRHVRTALVHDWEQTRDAHAECRCAVHVPVQHVDRHARASGIHVKQARGGGSKNSYRVAVACIHADVALLRICALNVTRMLRARAAVRRHRHVGGSSA